MPDALYIPGAPSLGRPLKDNLSDPRCSAQHRRSASFSGSMWTPPVGFHFLISCRGAGSGKIRAGNRPIRAGAYLRLGRRRKEGKLHYIVGNSKFYDVLVPTERVYEDMLLEAGARTVQVKPIRKRNSKRNCLSLTLLLNCNVRCGNSTQCPSWLNRWLIR